MTDTLLNHITARASDRFKQRYGRDPQWIAAAPGRVNIIGEHIDYNDGFVLPMAIDRYCVIAAAENSGSEATVYSVATDEEAKIQLAPSGATGSASAGHWSNYVAGVIAGCASRNLRPSGFNAVSRTTSAPASCGNRSRNRYARRSNDWDAA